MGRFYRDLEKSELHVHLEGSLGPETLLELDPSLDAAEIQRRYAYTDFHGFIESFKWVLGCLHGPGEYGLAARRLFERMAGEHITYAEVTVAGSGIIKRGLDFGRVYEALSAEAARAETGVRWIVDAARQFGAEHAMEVARLAVERAGEGVVAFGLGGIEAEGPVEEFAGVFRFARSRGLGLTPHAGETEGAASVRAALDAGADRIGHGIRAADDPALLERLRVEGVPLEICITSNVATGAVARLDEHPVRRIYESGVPIILNSDDPAMFHTTLSEEFELAEREFGFDRAELREIARNGFRYALPARA